MSSSATIVGAGPNGLAAAICLAEAGYQPVVYEAAAEVGGGARSGPLLLDGFLHDLGSAIHPLALASPLFARLPLAEHGLSWIQPPVPLAHPLDDGSAVLLQRSLSETAEGLGTDAASYRRLFGPLVERWPAVVQEALSPPLHLPRHPGVLLRLALRLRGGAASLAERSFSGVRAKALLAGIAAHANVPLDRLASAAVALLLGSAGHTVGWPLPRGGAGKISAALADHLRTLGGEVSTGVTVRSLADLPLAAVTLLDCTPRQVLTLSASSLPARYQQQLQRYRYGPGAFKLDWALSEPIPWRASACALAATVHLGGQLEEIAASEAAAYRGSHFEQPFVILVQPTLFDPSRAPAGRHVAWAYCHVPHASTRDMTAAIEAQIERFAPGFRQTILARRAWPPAALEALNPNLVGGDIGGGALSGSQFPFRPQICPDPYATPVRGLYLCSSATPPGPGVHGLCGMYAAQAALRQLRR